MRACFAVLVFSFLLVGCEDRDNLYMYDATVVSKDYDKSSSEPLKVTFRVSLNGHEKTTVTCRIKNVLKPMWNGLSVGKVVKITKTSSFDYSPEMVCGLINDAKVADVLK